MNAAAIAAALGGAASSVGWSRCPCPVHHSAGPTLGLRDSPMGLAIVCHAGCARNDVLAELRRLGLVDDGDLEPQQLDPAELERQRAGQERNDRRRRDAALDIWNNDTSPPIGTVVERYWCSRGLTLPVLASIRASASWLRHPEGGSRPVMIGLVEHVDRGSVGIHRTFLAVDGSMKASFREPRLSLGPIKGGAVRLAGAAETLVVGEGIETTASVMTATGIPAWAALSTSGLMNLVLPALPLAATVIITADNDKNGAGQRAARTAAERWIAEGRSVRIALPPIPGTDWNDILRNRDDRELCHAVA